MATLYWPNGTQQPVLPENGTTFTLDELQFWINGTIEVVPGRIATRMGLADEDGLMKHLPLNPVASALFGRPLAGPILLLTDKEMGD